MKTLDETEETSPCSHVWKLKEFLKNEGLDVYSEHGEGPPGWVNIHCPICNRTFQERL